jgi:hypothetical protein
MNAVWLGRNCWCGSWCSFLCCRMQKGTFGAIPAIPSSMELARKIGFVYLRFSLRGIGIM